MPYLFIMLFHCILLFSYIFLTIIMIYNTIILMFYVYLL